MLRENDASTPTPQSKTASPSFAPLRYAAIAEHLRTKAPPRAAIPEPDVANAALRAFGALKHDAPSFEPFDPVATENTAVVLKEVKLPHAEQTHEVVYEPQTRCVFVSQMSNSVLVRIPVSSTSGLLLDDQDAWRVADEKAGLHNVSLSYKHPGCLWLSLQFANTLLLVEARTMRVRSVLRVPTHLPKVNDEPARRIGGPHAVRECPKTGDVWVALKGAVSCHPGAPEPDQAFTGTRRVREAVKRNCCSAAALRDHMAAMAAHGYDSPPPDGFAIWRVSVDAYDPEKPANGGTVYPCAASPPMMTVDAENHCWVALDQTPALLRIDAATGVGTQIPVSLPPSFTLQMTGPAIASGPDGGVWCTLLGGHAALARVDPATRKVAIYELGGPAWAKALRLIHLTFAARRRRGRDRAAASLDRPRTHRGRCCGCEPVRPRTHRGDAAATTRRTPETPIRWNIHVAPRGVAAIRPEDILKAS